MNFSQYLDDLGLSPKWLMTNFEIPASHMDAYLASAKRPSLSVLRIIANLRVLRDYRINAGVRDCHKAVRNKVAYLISYEKDLDLQIFEPNFINLPLSFHKLIVSEVAHRLERMGIKVIIQPMNAVEYLEFLGTKLPDTFENKINWAETQSHNSRKLRKVS